MDTFGAQCAQYPSALGSLPAQRTYTCSKGQLFHPPKGCSETTRVRDSKGVFPLKRDTLITIFVSSKPYFLLTAA